MYYLPSLFSRYLNYIDIFLAEGTSFYINVIEWHLISHHFYYKTLK